MNSHQRLSTRQVNLVCPSCTQSFVYDTHDLKAGSAIICPKCQIHYICGTKELFTALKHIGKMVS
jgi:Zn finger protein HypA/HybF involved in hydrogenase expression